MFKQCCVEVMHFYQYYVRLNSNCDTHSSLLSKKMARVLLNYIIAVEEMKRTWFPTHFLSNPLENGAGGGRRMRGYTSFPPVAQLPKYMSPTVNKLAEMIFITICFIATTARGRRRVVSYAVEADVFTTGMFRRVLELATEAI